MIGRVKVGKVVSVATFSVSGKNYDSCQGLEVFYLQNPLPSKTCANIINASVIESFPLNSRLIG